MSAKQSSGGFNEDALLEYVIRTRRFFIKNKGTIITISLIVLALAVFLVVRAVESKKAEEEASTAFERVAVMLRGNVMDRIGDIETQLSDIVKKWPNTLGAARASFHLADMQYKLENYAAAIESYTRASKYSSSIHLYPASILGLANTYEQTGDLEKAVVQYDRIGTASNSFGYRNSALIGKARCLAVMGDRREARRLLEIVSAGNSLLAEEAEQVLIWLEGLDSLQETQILPGN